MEMNREYLIYFTLVILVSCGLIFFFIRERKFLKKSAKDTMSKKLKEEIDAERHADLHRKKKFEDSLRRFEV